VSIQPNAKRYNVEPDWSDGYDAEKILRTDKNQYGIENNFSFLKDDPFVHAIFLKRPERIEAIGWLGSLRASCLCALEADGNWPSHYHRCKGDF